MKTLFAGAAGLLLSTAPVMGGGIERAPQSLGILFEQRNYGELSFGGADPTIEGTDAAGFRTGDVAQGYGFVGLGYKHQFTDNLSLALIFEQPFGADVRYAVQPGLPDPAIDGSVLLGGTYARVDSTTFTALLRYRFDNNFSVHGGLRGSRADGSVGLAGLGYSTLSGYEVRLDDSWGAGYVIGAAYEIPEIAARVSLTYNSTVDHEFDTVETHPLLPADISSVTEVNTPQSITLEGQTGIAPGTLLFGSVRWVKWSEFIVAPRVFSRAPTLDDPLGFGVTEGLVTLEDTTTFNIGIGRQFNDSWAGSVSFAYEKEGDALISPLAPSTGRKGVTVAGIYTQGPIKVTTGISYNKLGDASPATGGESRAEMRDSEVWGIGMRIGYSF